MSSRESSRGSSASSRGRERERKPKTYTHGKKDKTSNNDKNHCVIDLGDLRPTASREADLARGTGPQSDITYCFVGRDLIPIMGKPTRWGSFRVEFDAGIACIKRPRQRLNSPTGHAQARPRILGHLKQTYIELAKTKAREDAWDTHKGAYRMTGSLQGDQHWFTDGTVAAQRTSRKEAGQATRSTVDSAKPKYDQASDETDPNKTEERNHC